MNLKRFNILFLLLLAAVLLVACSPAGSVATPEPAAQATPQPATETPMVETPTVETPESTPTPEAEGPGAALSARQALAQQLQLDPADIAIVSYEEVEWPDACLGVPVEGIMCAQVITPGYRVILEANGQQYEFHTNENGGNVRLAIAPEPEIGEPVITWSQSSDGLCQTAAISGAAIALGPCDGPFIEGRFAAEQRAGDLDYFSHKYGSFTADTAAGAVHFTGQGEVTAAPAEQRMIAEWARLVTLEAAAGRSNASWGVAFAWHREGGIAGFCEDVTVYVTGEAYATSCQGNEPRELGRVRLNAPQLQTLYHWIDTLKGFEFEQKDPATVDAMTIRLVFAGAGEAEASDADRQAMQALAIDVLAQASVTSY